MMACPSWPALSPATFSARPLEREASLMRLESTRVGFHNWSSTKVQVDCSMIALLAMLASRTCKHFPLRALRNAKYPSARSIAQKVCRSSSWQVARRTALPSATESWSSSMQWVRPFAGDREYGVLSTNSGQPGRNTPSTQVPDSQRFAVQFAVLQSSSFAQVLPCAQGEQLPPQLRSVSSPLRAKSVQLGG